MNKKPSHINVRVLASVPNFEKAYLDEDTHEDKPYNALRKLESDPVKFGTVRTLLDALVDHSKDVPEGAKEWALISELESLFASR